MLTDHVEEIVARFALGSAIDEVHFAARGEQGQVWRVQTDRGSFAIKELLVAASEEDAALSADYQAAVLRAGVVAPAPIRSRSGSVLAEVGGHLLRAYSWLDLLPVDRDLDPALVGATVAAIHRVHHEPARPMRGWYADPVGAGRWGHLRRGAVAAGAPFADALTDEIPTLLALEALLEPPRTLQNCHRDLWSDNLLPMSDGGMCVIDWENCGLEDPAHEVPMLLVDFAVGDAQRTRDLYAAYLDGGGPARVRGRGDFTMVIAQFGHFWESAVQTYLAPGATAEGQQHSLDRIAELRGEPLRLQHIDDTLDALSGLG